MDFMLNAGGTTGNYDTNLCSNVRPKLWANKRDIQRHKHDIWANSEDLPQKRPKIWGKSQVSASPKLRANKLDIDRPDSCSGRPAAETPADLVLATGELTFSVV